MEWKDDRFNHRDALHRLLIGSNQCKMIYKINPPFSLPFLPPFLIRGSTLPCLPPPAPNQSRDRWISGGRLGRGVWCCLRYFIRVRRTFTEEIGNGAKSFRDGKNMPQPQAINHNSLIHDSFFFFFFFFFFFLFCHHPLISPCAITPRIQIIQSNQIVTDSIHPAGGGEDPFRSYRSDSSLCFINLNFIRL